jgi:glycosyltransferase involved in cell wall biosynthesis
MTKIMGLQFLIDIHKEILDINENIVILIAGAEGDLSEKALNLSISNSKIKYYSNVPFSEKQTIYNNSDIIIAPTLEKHACMGVTIKEGMACKKPIIASDSGGIPEAIIDGEEGFIIPIENNHIPKNLFVDKIRQLYHNPILRNEMGEKGHKRALEIFTNKASVEKYIKIIEKNH